jgi:predicted nucleic acid-binding protein
LILDSNVVIDVIEAADTTLIERLAELRRAQGFHVNEIIFAEVASGFSSVDQVERLFAELEAMILPLSLAECFRAGQAFRAYRRNGGPRTTILPDFLIGAQAAVRGWPILTRDPKRFTSYFPEVEVIDPM